MNFDAIKTISAAESQAEKIRAEAASEAKRILAQAEADGEALVLKAKEEANVRVSHLYADADRAGTAEAQKLSKQPKKMLMPWVKPDRQQWTRLYPSSPKGFYHGNSQDETPSGHCTFENSKEGIERLNSAGLC